MMLVTMIIINNDKKLQNLYNGDNLLMMLSEKHTINYSSHLILTVSYFV